MTKNPRRALMVAVYGVSAALHLAFAAAAVLAPKEKKNTVVAISISSTRKPPPKPEAPPPPPPPAPTTPAPVKRAPAPVAAKAPPEIAPVNPPPPANAEPAFADLGLTLGNGAGGMAVRAAPVASAPSPARETTHTVRALAPTHEEACSEPIVKAKLRGAVVKPAYNEEARTAQIEGVVRVEMTVDELGNVIAVKVLKGLGYGLDDAATRAAKQMTFEPGTRCGKAALTKLTVGMRFSLQQ